MVCLILLLNDFYFAREWSVVFNVDSGMGTRWVPITHVGMGMGKNLYHGRVWIYPWVWVCLRGCGFRMGKPGGFVPIARPTSGGAHCS
jgi:hypothetical protein